MEAAKEAAENEDDCQGIRKIFRQWDANGDGSITRVELKRVLLELSPMSERDVDRLMQEADVNGNGLIEYDEFVDWLMKPPAKSEVRALLDYKAVLRPLFDIYDRNGNGRITFEEFEECHGILRSVLQRHTQPKEDHVEDPLDLNLDAKLAFKRADVYQDGEVTFPEFVEWMRDHMVKTSCEKGDLENITQKLARMLQQVFKLQSLQNVKPLRRQYVPSADEAETKKVYERLLANLAQTTLCFGQALEDHPAPPDELRNFWTEPPPGMSVHRLRGMHMRLYPVKPHDIEEISFEAVCIPCVLGAWQGASKKGGPRKWLGEVVRKVRYTPSREVRGGPAGRRVSKGLNVQVDRPKYYIYEPGTLRWSPCESAAAYEKAWQSCSRPLQMFCLMKTEADLGEKLKWPGTMAVLKAAVSLDIITWNDVDTFEMSMRDEVRLMYAKPSSDQELVSQFLETQLELQPRHVMVKLSDLGILKVTSEWKDFIDFSSSRDVVRAAVPLTSAE